MTASESRLAKISTSSQNKHLLVQKTSENLMGINVGRLVKTIATCTVWMAICPNKAIHRAACDGCLS